MMSLKELGQFILDNWVGIFLVILAVLILSKKRILDYIEKRQQKKQLMEDRIIQSAKEQMEEESKPIQKSFNPFIQVGGLSISRSLKDQKEAAEAQLTELDEKAKELNKAEAELEGDYIIQITENKRVRAEMSNKYALYASYLENVNTMINTQKQMDEELNPSGD